MSDNQNVVEAREAGDFFRVNSGGHFEHGLIRGGGRDFSDYAQYVSDHHLVEIMVGGVNWREFGSRANRVGGPIDNSVFLLYEDDQFVLNVSHEYNKLSGNAPSAGSGGAIGGLAAGIGNIVQGIGNVAGGAFSAFQGAQGASDLQLSPLRILNASFYEKSDPWQLPMTFTFRMGQNGIWDARKEVFDPIMALLTMTTVIDKGDTARIGANERFSLDGIPVYETPGNTLMGMLGSVGSELITGGIDTLREEGMQASFEQILRNLTTGAEQTLEGLNKNVTVVVGLTHEEASTDEEGAFSTSNRDDWNQRNVFFFNPCIIKNVTASFSREKDMRGFPIEGSVKLDIETMMPAMANDISGIRQDGQRRDALLSDAITGIFNTFSPSPANVDDGPSDVDGITGATTSNPLQ